MKRSIHRRVIGRCHAVLDVAVEPAIGGGQLVPLQQELAGVGIDERVAILEEGHDVVRSTRGPVEDAEFGIGLLDHLLGDAGQIIAGYREYCDQLRQFSVDHDLGIFDAGHDELWHSANAAGLTYKPCGAGGGDVGILLGTDTAELDAFTGTQR